MGEICVRYWNSTVKLGHHRREFAPLSPPSVSTRDLRYRLPARKNHRFSLRGRDLDDSTAAGLDACRFRTESLQQLRPGCDPVARGQVLGVSESSDRQTEFVDTVIDVVDLSAGIALVPLAPLESTCRCQGSDPGGPGEVTDHGPLERAVKRQNHPFPDAARPFGSEPVSGVVKDEEALDELGAEPCERHRMLGGFVPEQDAGHRRAPDEPRRAAHLRDASARPLYRPLGADAGSAPCLPIPPSTERCGGSNTVCLSSA